jgi:hypothetical protein
MNTSTLRDPMRQDLIAFLSEIMSLALRAECIFKRLPDFDIKSDDPDWPDAVGRLEVGVATCRELVARMGWIADIASTGLGVPPMADAKEWILPELLGQLRGGMLVGSVAGEQQ